MTYFHPKTKNDKLFADFQRRVALLTSHARRLFPNYSDKALRDWAAGNVYRKMVAERGFSDKA